MKVLLKRRKNSLFKKAAILVENREGGREPYAVGVAGGKVGEVPITEKGWETYVYDIFMPDRYAKRVVEFLDRQIGKRKSLLKKGFKLSSDTDPKVLSERRKKKGVWRDAELVLAALRKGGCHLFRGKYLAGPHETTPHHLGTSGGMVFREVLTHGE